MRSSLRAATLVLALTLALSSSFSFAQRNVTVSPTPATATSAFYSDSWAVIIGINEYQHPRVPKLRYAVNDARSVQEALLAQGFRRERVITLTDQHATKAAIERVLGDEMRLKVGRSDRVFVFFAGHGKTDRLGEADEEGYLIPVDGDPSALYSTGISMEGLRRLSARIPAKHILYVMDACYSGYAIYNRAVADDLLDEMVKKPAIQILTAGRQGDQAAERNGHGVFTEVLVRGLKGDAFSGKNWLSLEELGVWMKQRVFAESGKQQLPQFGNLSGEGQFVFLKAGAQVASIIATPSPKLEIKEEVRQQFGSLALSAKLDGIEVWLDDHRIGETRIDRALVVNDVPVGTHRVLAKKDDHKEWAREVAVVANRREEVAIDIEAAEPKQQVAIVTPPGPEIARHRTPHEGTWNGEAGIWRAQLTVSGDKIGGTLWCFRVKSNSWSNGLSFSGSLDSNGNLAASSTAQTGWALRRLRGRFPLIVVESITPSTTLDCPNGALSVQKSERP